MNLRLPSLARLSKSYNRALALDKQITTDSKFKRYSEVRVAIQKAGAKLGLSNEKRAMALDYYLSLASRRKKRETAEGGSAPSWTLSLVRRDEDGNGDHQPSRYASRIRLRRAAIVVSLVQAMGKTGVTRLPEVVRVVGRIPLLTRYKDEENHRVSTPIGLTSKERRAVKRYLKLVGIEVGFSAEVAVRNIVSRVENELRDYEGFTIRQSTGMVEKALVSLMDKEAYVMMEEKEKVRYGAAVAYALVKSTVPGFWGVTKEQVAGAAGISRGVLDRAVVKYFGESVGGGLEEARKAVERLESGKSEN